MLVVTLPDGSKREFDAPVRVIDIAQRNLIFHPLIGSNIYRLPQLGDKSIGSTP